MRDPVSRATPFTTTGESGQPFTAHYDDNLADWRAVNYHPLPFTRAAVEAAAVHILTLRPGH